MLPSRAVLILYFFISLSLLATGQFASFIPCHDLHQHGVQLQRVREFRLANTKFHSLAGHLLVTVLCLLELLPVAALNPFPFIQRGPCVYITLPQNINL
jgi:hypothetical protein